MTATSYEAGTFVAKNSLCPNFHDRSRHGKFCASNSSPRRVRLADHLILDRYEFSEVLSHPYVVTRQFDNIGQISSGLGQNRFNVLESEPELFSEVFWTFAGSVAAYLS